MAENNNGLQIRRYNRVSFFREQVLTLVKALNPSEQIFIIYTLATGFYIVFYHSFLPGYSKHLWIRLAFLSGVAFFYFLQKKFPFKWTGFLRMFFPISASGLFYYTETGFMNTMLFPNHFDPYLIQAEYYLFGCMPSDLFCLLIPYKWFNEMLNFGYFSYFCIIMLPLFYYYFAKKNIVQEASFLGLFSLLSFYCLFIVFPTAGPQFSYPDLKLMQNHIPDAYLFRSIVKYIQDYGEAATGAFPSSHVGVAIMMLYITWKFGKRIFYGILPIVIILILSTVYIRAHYVVDVFGGLIFGIIFIILGNLLFQALNRTQQAG